MTEEKEKVWKIGNKLQTKADTENIVVGINGGEEKVPRSSLTKMTVKKVLLADGSTQDTEVPESDIGGFISRKAQSAGLKNIVVEVNGQSVEASDVQDLDPSTIETIDIRAYDVPR